MVGYTNSILKAWYLCERWGKDGKLFNLKLGLIFGERNNGNSENLRTNGERKFVNISSAQFVSLERASDIKNDIN